MEKLKTMVNALDEMNEREQIVKQLQEIGKVLLTEYEIKVGDVTIQPLLLEAYYYNSKSFPDCNMHLVEEQQEFNVLYRHSRTENLSESGRVGGVDICLACNKSIKSRESDKYYLSFLIKNALVNHVFCRQVKINAIINDKINPKKKIENMLTKKADNDAKNTKCLFLERLGLTNDCYKAERLAVLSISDLVNYNYDYTLQPYNKLSRLKTWRDAIIDLANDENAYVDCDYSDFEKESDGKLKSINFNYHKLARIDWNYSKTKFLNKE